MNRVAKLSSLFGGLIWAILIVLPIERILLIGIIEKLLLLGPLVIVPMGMRLLSIIEPQVKTRLFFRLAILCQQWAALCVICSFFSQPGRWPGLLAMPWMITCCFLMSAIVLENFSNRIFEITKMAALAAVIYLLIGSVWLLLSRLGINPMNFGEPIVLLTAVHFTFSGFTASLIISAAGMRFDLGSSWKKAYIGFSTAAILSTPLIATGFVFSPQIKVVGIAIFAMSLHGLAVVSLRRLPTIPSWSAKFFLAISAISIFSGMILAAIYGISEFEGKILISIPQMARTHGIINAVGFGFCGMVGWLIYLSQEDVWHSHS